jgi:hypothetical protein
VLLITDSGSPATNPQKYAPQLSVLKIEQYVVIVQATKLNWPNPLPHQFISL